MQLQKAVSLFLNEYIPTTRRTYYYTLKPFMDYIGPARPLEQIKIEDLLEYMQALDARPTLKSPRSYNKHLKSLRTFFYWCVRLNFIEKSPVMGLRLRTTRNRARIRAMPDHLYHELVEYTRALEIARKDQRAFSFVLFLGDTGCRVGGAAGLEWSEINFDDLSAIVTEKNKEPRLIFFGRECASALKRWRLAQHQRRGNYVFTRDGGRIKSDNLGQYFRRLCIAAGIGSYGPHSLRHRKGFQVIDNDLSPAIGAEILGDTLEVFLEFYTPKDVARVKQTVDRLSFKGDAPRVSKIRKFKG